MHSMPGVGIRISDIYICIVHVRIYVVRPDRMINISANRFKCSQTHPTMPLDDRYQRDRDHASNTLAYTLCLCRSFQVRRSLKIRGRRKEKEKLPSGITADYSAEFFAHLDIDRGVERDRGVEEVLADGNHTIDNNGDGEHPYAANISHSDSSETSLHSVGANKVRECRRWPVWPGIGQSEMIAAR